MPGFQGYWPNTMYFIDVIEGFKTMYDLRRADPRLSFRTLFKKAFPYDKPPTIYTFLEVLYRWNTDAGPEYEMLKQEFLNAGRSSRTHWAAFDRRARDLLEPRTLDE
ncbi:hypothetical protein BKA70DRAFT_1309056 [Coprinopsis sp. MPI-PUGE-AT-0042]|nr:hypothetical protein BKA70DRAFT_1309056 [Coprinopsis sp. MPI-PUGE-AT-0042]